MRPARLESRGDVPTMPLQPKSHRAQRIELPAPGREGGIPLMRALALRRSTREYTAQPLAPSVLSDLLWAAFGINRSTGDRTAPYWRHIMVIDLYVARDDGVWFYDPSSQALVSHLQEDVRSHTGTQDFVAGAALDLVYVARGERMTDVSPEDRRLYASVDSAFIGQNVYLYCASQGLGTVFRGAVNTEELGRILKLPKEQFVTFAQTVGHAAS